MSEKSVAEVFDALSEKDLKNKLKRAFDELGKTAAGRETLGYLDKLGYKVEYEAGLASSKCLGVCAADQNAVLLNPFAKAEDIPSILVHETQHAVQFEKHPDGVEVESTQIGDMFKFRRAMEADACAHQAAYAYEAGKEGIDARMPAGYEPILTVYTAEMDKSGNKKQAMNAAFKQWYKSEQKMDFYDTYYTSAVCEQVVDGLIQDGTKGCFTNKKTDKEWADIFVFEGKPYVEPQFFSSPESYGLKPDDKKKIMAAMKKYSQKTGTPLDTSVLGMHDRKTGSASKTMDAPANGNKKTAVAAALIRRKRER